MEPWQHFETVLLEREGHIALLTLNRPDRLNAMNSKMLFEEIPAAVNLVNADEGIRVLVITGAGRGFCSGREVGEIGAQTGEQPRPMIPAPAGKEARLLRDLQIPAVAAVNGAAAGAGFGLALTCDFRIAGASAKFKEAHLERALCPSVAAWYLPRLVGLTRAMEIAIAGMTLSAQDALAMGLVSRVVPDADLLPGALAFAGELAALPPFAVKATKRAIMEGLASTLDENLELIGRLRALGNALTDESAQAAQAFLKR